MILFAQNELQASEGIEWVDVRKKSALQVGRFFRSTLESATSHKGNGDGAARDSSRLPFISGGGGYNQVSKQLIQNQVGLRSNNWMQQLCCGLVDLG